MSGLFLELRVSIGFWDWVSLPLDVRTTICKHVGSGWRPSANKCADVPNADLWRLGLQTTGVF